jgi:hypothetical protein
MSRPPKADQAIPLHSAIGPYGVIDFVDASALQAPAVGVVGGPPAYLEAHGIRYVPNGVVEPAEDPNSMMESHAGPEEQGVVTSDELNSRVDARIKQFMKTSSTPLVRMDNAGGGRPVAVRSDYQPSPAPPSMYASYASYDPDPRPSLRAAPGFVDPGPSIRSAPSYRAPYSSSEADGYGPSSIRSTAHRPSDYYPSDADGSIRSRHRPVPAPRSRRDDDPFSRVDAPFDPPFDRPPLRSSSLERSISGSRASFDPPSSGRRHPRSTGGLQRAASHLEDDDAAATRLRSLRRECEAAMASSAANRVRSSSPLPFDF